MKSKFWSMKNCLWAVGLVTLALLLLIIDGQGKKATPPTPGADHHARGPQFRAEPSLASALDEGTAQESEQTAHVEQAENDGSEQDRAAVQDATEAAAVSDAVAPIGPRQAEGRVFPQPDLPALAARLPAGQQAVFERIHREFPAVNLTDTQAYHGIQGVKRQEFGFDLTDATADQYRQWIADADALHRQLVALWAGDLGLSRVGMDEQGRGYALIGFEKGQPVYTYTMNVQAAVSTGANLLRWNPDFDPALTRTVDGTGIYVNINDHGEIFEHDEFQLPYGGGSRIMVAEARPPGDHPGDRDHMTHVAGTVAAWGYSSDLLGMAPRVWIRSLILQSSDHITTYAMRFPGELHNSLNPRTGEMQVKSTMGNTSIGSLAHDLRYVEVSQSFDIVLRDFPYYIHFYAAGNNGSQLWGKTGFGSLSNDRILSKNTLSIGSVNNVNRDANGNYVSGGNIYIHDFKASSRGPTYDGRIKPDFVANGVQVRSSIGTNDSALYTGTSMASPTAAGSTALLIDYVQQRFPGHFFRSSTYKAALMNTADDLGNPGPDYTYGWGLINIYAAGQKIRHHAENSYDRVLREERLHPGQTWTYTYHSNGGEPIRASLAWLDVAGEAQERESTDRSPRLVNDLDMRIIGPGGTVYAPYVMPFVSGQGSTPAFDASLHNAHATTGDNFTDPAEQIYIPNPAAGTYTIQITHKGNLRDDQPQPFSLAVGGMTSTEAAPAAITSVIPNLGENLDNFPMAVLGNGFVLGSDVFLRRHASPVVQGDRVIPVGDRIDFHVDIEGIAPGDYDIVVRAPNGTETLLENGFRMPGIEDEFSPIIFTHPASQAVLKGESVTFSVVAAGNPLPSYQWYLNDILIEGASSASYTINPVEIADEGSYHVRVSNDAGDVTSEAATLTILVPPPPAPTGLTATAVAFDQIDLAWSDASDLSEAFRIERSADGSTWSTLTTVTGSSYSDTGLTGGSTWHYRVIALRDGQESDPSATASATTPAAPSAPVITQAPQAQTVLLGGTAVFTVVAKGSPAPGYQWYVNNTLIPEATAATLEIVDVQFEDEGLYHVRVSNSEGHVESEPVWLVATVPPPGPQLFARINFQTNVAAPDGWLRDIGEAYDDRGNGFHYGWSGNNTGTSRLRNSVNSPDFQHDTLVHMQLNNSNFTWEIAVPNGSYQVRIVAGDPSNLDSVYRINVEGTLVVDGTPTSGNRWIDGQATVEVSDGLLNVTNAAGASNNKICFIEIHTVPEPGSGYDAWAVNLPVGQRAKTHILDGVPNLLRYAFGGDETTPASFFRLQAQASASGMTLSFPRMDDLQLTYEIWGSQDLVDWGVDPVWSGLGDGPTTFTLENPAPLWFLHLRVRWNAGN